MKDLFFLPIILCICIVGGFLLQIILPGDLAWLGIRPRSLIGLIGILLSPFLHGSLQHLVANLIPLFVLACFVNLLAPELFFRRTIVLIFVSGLLTWLASSSGLVIGASGLVFAYWAFLLSNGVLNRRIKDIGIAVLTLVFYGALIFSLLSYQKGISWVGHISGVIAGIGFAISSAKMSINSQTK